MIEHPSYAAGALDWNQGDLTYAGGVSTVLKVRLAGQFAESGKTVVIDQLIGGLYVTGETGKIVIYSGTAFFIDLDRSLYGLDFLGPLPATGTVVVGGGITGQLRVYGDCQGVISMVGVPGSLIIDGDIAPGSIVNVSSIGLSEESGYVRVGGNVASGATLYVGSIYNGEVRIDGNLIGEMWLGDVQSSSLLAVGGDIVGDVFVVHYLPGQLEIYGDLAGNLDVTRPTHIDGGRVYVHGSLRSSGSISTSTLINNAAIAIDYDGWHSADTWQTGGTVTIDETTYTGNTPALNIWEIQPCKGDMTNEHDLDPNDLTWLASVIADPNYVDYNDAFPGLDGSIWWHANINCDLADPNDPDTYILDDVDLFALAFFLGDPNDPNVPQCCLTDCAEYAACRADLDRSGEVDLPDLSLLLAAYNPNYDPDADLDADDDVDLLDLAALLAAYGNTCTCFGGGGEAAAGGGAAPESGGGGAAALSWAAAITPATKY